jgi:hypothetical protein
MNALDQAKQYIMYALDGSNGHHCSQLFRACDRIPGITDEIVSDAINALLSEKRIEEANSWFRKRTPPIRLESQDDLDWLRGEGRWAQ